jgi:hypothetical protein
MIVKMWDERLQNSWLFGWICDNGNIDGNGSIDNKSIDSEVT